MPFKYNLPPERIRVLAKDKPLKYHSVTVYQICKIELGFDFHFHLTLALKAMSTAGEGVILSHARIASIEFGLSLVGHILSAKINLDINLDFLSPPIAEVYLDLTSLAFMDLFSLNIELSSLNNSLILTGIFGLILSQYRITLT